MIAECQNEETMLMWSTANELLAIVNSNEEKNRLDEFKRRFCEIRQQQMPLLPRNSSQKSTRTHSSIQKLIVPLDPSLTTCEELHIIESIYRLSQCTYPEAKRMAEETYLKVICTNNRENQPTNSREIISEQWFLSFAIRQIGYLRKYSSIWLPDLETIKENLDNPNDLHSFISLMKETV